MAKIDTSGWKEFKLTDIFRMNNTKSIVQKDVVPDSGTVPYVTAQAWNNGVMTYIDCPAEWLDKGDCIMIGGKTLTFSYQAQAFCSNDSHNIALHLKDAEKASEMRYLFLIAALRGSLYQKYSWGDSISMKTIKNDVFQLPVDASGEPDWAYMDEYMSAVMRESEASLESLRQAGERKQMFEISNWKEFPIGGEHGLFDVVKGSRLTKAAMREGTINFISASSFNNGIAAHIANTEHVHPGNTLTVSYNGSDIGRTFYQKEPFWASDDVNVLYPRFKLNERIALFLAPLIKEAGGSHVYKNKWLQTDMMNTMIPLPITEEGNPDWDYMDEYMCALLERTDNNLIELQTVI